MQTKAIYAYISSFAANSNSGERTAFPSVELQCGELGISENTYYAHRKALIEKGYLKIERIKGEQGKFDRNTYIICAVPIPIETNELKVPNESIPQKLGYGENVDLEPSEPYLKNSCMDNPSMDNSGTKTTKTKTNSSKKNISLVSSSSRESADSLYELINKTLKQKYPDVPFDEIRDKLITDETAVINTAKQYHAMLEYRLKNYKPRKQAQGPQYKTIRHTHKEELPYWFDEELEAKADVKQEVDISDEEKAELEEILKSMRNKE
jgi:hypothetical protein